MACKDILVHFDNTPAGIARVEAAVGLAERHDAHLTALMLAMEPQRFPGTETAVPPSILRDLRKAATEEAERATVAFDALLARQGRPVERRVVRCWPDEIADTLALQARYADLLVLGQPGSDELSYVDSFVVETVLLSSGRPTLLIPYIGARETIGRRVLVAWDGRREAARAVADAMPLLEAAGSVTVLTINPDKTGRHGELPGADIALHLARHGIAVETASIQNSGLDPADVALNWMAEHGTDLLVMGAYGHSRVRELFLGGMTRGMLQHMTVPVLMSH